VTRQVLDLCLDNNVVSTYLSKGKGGNTCYPAVKNRLDSARSSKRKIRIPVMVISEIESGFAMADSFGPPTEETKQARKDIRSFLSTYEKVNINSHTVLPYSMLRGRIFQLYAKRDGNRRKFVQRKTHDICDRITDLSIGIDERDLFIASAAVQENLMLATLDAKKEMKAIIQAAESLEADGSLIYGKPFKLHYEYWDQ
jgi:predicted nucleic acid-binding protein